VSLSPNGIGSAVLQSSQSNTDTRKATPSVAIGRIYVMHAMRSEKEKRPNLDGGKKNLASEKDKFNKQ